MDAGDLLTRWTVRLSMVLYVLALALRWNGRGDTGRLAAARRAWIGGCLLFLGHVIFAFACFHHWSHAAAFEETARRTEEMFGFFWGGGLYLNYAFTSVWLIDAAWWWLWPATFQRRGQLVEWLVQGYMGFMAFNGAVVFAAWPVRIAGLVGCVVLLAAWTRRERKLKTDNE